MKEKIILNETLRVLGTHPKVKIWRNNTGMAYTGNNIFRASKKTPIWLNAGDIVIRKAHPIKFGLTGSADILGIMHNGTFIAIETKTPTGRLSQQQKNFKKMIENFNGCYKIVRCADDIQNIQDFLDKL